MSPGAVTAIAVLLAFASLHEVLAVRERHAGGLSPAALESLSRSRFVGLLGIGLPDRIRRAGLEGELSVRSAVLAKLGAAASGALLGLAAAPAAPGRLAILVVVAMPAAGFLAPDAALERFAARRRARLLAALPDALDLIGAGTASGRSIPLALGQAAARGGPLEGELGAAAAEMSCGVPQREALGNLRRRVPGSEVAALCAAIDRSRRLGSPLADQLRRQSTDLRRSRRRAVEEQAARAAPKIQLVVALVLVPAVLLIIVAGLIANADRLLGGLI